MSEAFSISVTGDDHAENHSRRAYTPSNAERSLQSDNIVIYDCGNDREAFNDFFRDDILAYNAKQKREDRKKSLDYLQALEAGTEGYGKGDKKEKPFYHHVLQIGSNQTLGVTTDEFDFDTWKQLKKDGKYDQAANYVRQHLNRSKEREDMTAVLEEVGRGLQAKYPFCKFWGITIHRDEPHGTDHMDIRYTIFTDGEKTGLGKRVSMNKGLAKMGFKSDKERTALQKFQDAIKADIQAGMEARGYTRQYMDNHEKHTSTSVFQAQKDKEAAIAEMEEALGQIAQAEYDAVNKQDILKKQNKEIQSKANRDLEAAYEKRNRVYIEMAELQEKKATQQEEMDVQKKSMDESKQLLEELFRTMVRSMRGQGHEQDEVEFPDTNVKVAEILQAEMTAWQERLLQERQSMFARINELFEQMKKSADRDESRKQFLERTKVGGTDKTMEDVYQESIAKAHAKDKKIRRDAAEIVGVSLDDMPNEYEGME